MSFALSTGVTGLDAHQKMLDVAGNNIANVSTTAFKASRIVFSELLSETIKKASQPTADTGGTNPQQMGSGVGVGGITPLMEQGNIVSTGNPLDMAIEGEGYFVVSDGSKNVYTRAGAFAVDANSNLVDPATGYIVQRIGSTGESDGLQIVGDSNTRIPYDTALAAKATSLVKLQGNLSADAVSPTPQTQELTSDVTYSASNTTPNNGTLLTDLDQYSFTSGTPFTSATITVSGSTHDGTAITDSTPLAVTTTTTLGDVINHINAVLGSNGTATLSNGQIVISDATSGYSKLDVNLAFANSGDANLQMPNYFKYTTVGGEEVQNINTIIYDSQGGSHVLAGALVRTDTSNTWEMVLASVTGDVTSLGYDDRRIEGIKFSNEGSYTGLDEVIDDTAQFTMTFAHDTANPQNIDMDFGTVGKFNGLTQFRTGESGTSTAVAREQDGYAAGNLINVSVNKEGVIIGSFSNGVKKDIAALQIALFQNTVGLESVGGGYFIPSANSGEAIATHGNSGGAGAVHGGALEKSNADVATEFVHMIEAQNGYQANARTIRVANSILQELTSLIR
jgi:flagellar hook protein FlgE